MTRFFTTEQLADLIQINGICQAMGAELVVIGATAIMVQLGDLGRLTRDIDLTVALDLDDSKQFHIEMSCCIMRHASLSASPCAAEKARP